MTIRASVLDEEEPLTLHMKSAGFTDGQFYQLCADNPELRLELTAHRAPLIMSPTGGQTGRRPPRLPSSQGGQAPPRRLVGRAEAGGRLHRGEARRPRPALPGQDGRVALKK